MYKSTLLQHAEVLGRRVKPKSGHIESTAFRHCQIKSIEKLAGLLLVLIFHGGFAYGAWHYYAVPVQEEAVTLFVQMIAIEPTNTAPPLLDAAKPMPQKVKLNKPPLVAPPKSETLLASNSPVTAINEPVAAPPTPEPVINIPPVPEEPVVEAPAESQYKPEDKPQAPVTLSSDLSVACPQRPMPNYPVASRRMGEHGALVLRVELDETGHITATHIKKSSGYQRLDEAGMTAVNNWRCNATMRDGKAVRAVALQPFDFILEGR